MRHRSATELPAGRCFTRYQRRPVLVGVQPVQVVVSGHPRVRPSFERPAHNFAAQMPVVGVRNGRGLRFILTEPGNKAVSHGGLLTGQGWVTPTLSSGALAVRCRW